MTVPQPASPRPRLGRAVSVALGLSAFAALGFLLYEEGAPGRESAAEVASLLRGTEGARITYYRLDPKKDRESRSSREAAGFFETWTVVRKEPLTDPGEQRALRDALTSGSSYGTSSFHCFEPGMGFRLETDARILDLAVCLECKKVIAHERREDRGWSLSDLGCGRFRSLYDAHGP